MELLINKERVTHIKMYEYVNYGYTWVPAKTEKYFFGLCKEEYLEGYYRNGKYSSFYPRITKEELQRKYEYLVDWGDGRLMERPHIEIFHGDTLIYSKHFNSYFNVKNFVNDHFNDSKFIKIEINE